MATATQELTAIQSLVFTEISTQLRRVIGNVALHANVATRHHGGDHVHGSRLGAVAFWLSALNDCDLDRRQISELTELDRSFASVAALAGVKPGETREVLELFGNKLSEDARRWSLAVWRDSLPVDRNAEFERQLTAKRAAEELKTTLTALRAAEAEHSARPGRIQALETEIARLTGIAQGGDLN